jgi:hypothetical protein
MHSSNTKVHNQILESQTIDLALPRWRRNVFDKTTFFKQVPERCPDGWSKALYLSADLKDGPFLATTQTTISTALSAFQKLLHKALQASIFAGCTLLVTDAEPVILEGKFSMVTADMYQMLGFANLL